MNDDTHTMRWFSEVQMLSQEHFENTVFCFITESDDILHFSLMTTNVRGDWSCRELIPSLVFCFMIPFGIATLSASDLGYVGKPEVIQSKTKELNSIYMTTTEQNLSLKVQCKG